eukprot:gene10120-2539_t
MTQDSIFKEFSTIKLDGHKRKISNVGWSCDGKLASCSLDLTTKIWDLNKPDKPLELKGHTENIESLCFNPSDSSQLVTTSRDKNVIFWDVRSGESIKKISTNSENIHVSWKPDGSQIATASLDDIVTFIDTKNYETLKTKQFPVEVNELKWDLTEKFFFVTTGVGSVEILDSKDWSKYKSIQAHPSNIYSIDFKDDYFALGSSDSLISIWDAKELLCLKNISFSENPIRSLSMTHDGKYIAHGTENSLELNVVKNGKHEYQVKDRMIINTCAWHPKEYILAYSGEEERSSDYSIHLFKNDE